MVYLMLSVFCCVLLVLSFKLFPRYGIAAFPAIVVNYFTCVITAWIVEQTPPLSAGTLDAPWLPYGIFLGFVFISGFNLTASTVGLCGMGVTSVIQKMSLFLSVSWAILSFGESTGLAKILGLLLAVPAIFLVNDLSSPGAGRRFGAALWLIPLGTFLANGVIDSTFFYLKREGILLADDLPFSSFLFLTAACLGLLFWLLAAKRLQLGSFTPRTILGGILLGIPNFYSIYWLLKGLADFREGSVVIPLYNISIMLLSVVFGLLVFNESFSLRKGLGILLAILSLVLVSFCP